MEPAGHGKQLERSVQEQVVRHRINRGSSNRASQGRSVMAERGRPRNGTRMPPSNKRGFVGLVIEPVVQWWGSYYVRKTLTIARKKYDLDPAECKLLERRLKNVRDTKIREYWMLRTPAIIAAGCARVALSVGLLVVIGAFLPPALAPAIVAMVGNISAKLAMNNYKLHFALDGEARLFGEAPLRARGRDRKQQIEKVMVDRLNAKPRWQQKIITMWGNLTESMRDRLNVFLKNQLQKKVDSIVESYAMHYGLNRHQRHELKRKMLQFGDVKLREFLKKRLFVECSAILGSSCIVALICGVTGFLSPVSLAVIPVAGLAAMAVAAYYSWLKVDYAIQGQAYATVHDMGKRAHPYSRLRYQLDQDAGALKDYVQMRVDRKMLTLLKTHPYLRRRERRLIRLKLESVANAKLREIYHLRPPTLLMQPVIRSGLILSALALLNLVNPPLMVGVGVNALVDVFIGQALNSLKVDQAISGAFYAARREIKRKNPAFN